MSLKHIEKINNLKIIYTAWKDSKYGVTSGPYFPVFGLNTEYSVQIQENTDEK